MWFKRANRIPIDQLLSLTGLEPITKTIVRRVAIWIKKIPEVSHETVNICMNGAVNGKRVRGRPRTRWKDNLKKL